MMMWYPERCRDGGVSPVVGVMLMLVVVIIIAAVVSGFAGTLVSGQEKAPSAAMDVVIKNSGEWRGSYIQFDVKSVSEPFSSGDIKIVTSWSTASGIGGGNTTMKGLNAPNTHFGSSARYQAPLGYGPTISNWVASGTFKPEQHFGNYSISTGTTMRATPYGYTSYNAGYGVETLYEYRDEGTYWTSATDVDSMQAVLGKNWNNLRPGDIVKVMIMHIPSGKTIFNKNVVVVG